jgi:hypothetical protein
MGSGLLAMGGILRRRFLRVQLAPPHIQRILSVRFEIRAANYCSFIAVAPSDLMSKEALPH